jgi:hypothetical protein
MSHAWPYMCPRYTREQFDAGEMDAVEVFRDQIAGGSSSRQIGCATTMTARWRS